MMIGKYVQYTNNSDNIEATELVIREPLLVKDILCIDEMYIY